ncbi:uncharacterized protein J8A68_005228 [[Candida] subhashii]|uniref:Uncharacterized protein n=1 Tax=[Candida] subhashii TaxID=561895 RepID=A0A8J5UI92_9ASCO|nr:uncharacterized protein J8A68_005228 [[Candida] subhashii]KAG7661232.1 hypothetical protein J8A68_005228 [[Candida] subhashii]
MSGDWAAKLAVAPSTNTTTSTATTTSTSTNTTTQNINPSSKSNSPSIVTKKKSSSPTTTTSSPPIKKTSTPETTESQQPPFNSQEVLQYFNSNFSKYLQQAKEDKQGEHIKIYRSLESSSQWTTKISSYSSSTGQGGSSGNERTKHSAKDVIRNKSNTTNNTLDLLFEINRSIYQQK